MNKTFRPPAAGRPREKFASRSAGKRFCRTVDLRSSFPTPSGPTPLMVFRGEARTPRRLHPLELALLIVTALHLCFLPWAFGGMMINPWALWVSLGLAVTGFGLSLVPRHYTEEHAREGEFKLVMWPKLVRFPIFWLGLALLLYMTVQAANPAWSYFNNGSRWWMEPLRRDQYVTWLPTSMTAPMNGPGTWESMNAWRMILIYAAPWLTVCSLWVGITRRATLLALLGTIAVSGGLLAVVGLLERVAGNDKIFWMLDAGKATSYFVASFAHKGHAGAYFNLVVAAACALACWHLTRGDRRAGPANPAPLFALCAVLAGLIVLLSYSRAATILLLVFLVLMFIGLGVWVARAGTNGPNRALLALLGVIFVLFVAGSALVLDYGKVIERMSQLGTTDRELSVEGRWIADHATWEMIMDKPLTGWGAGSYRYYFPVYEQNYPALWNVTNARWEYAANDYLQILAELGLVGGLLLVAGTGYWVIRLLRHQAHTRPHALLLIAGLGMLMLQALVDLPLYCPAVLLTWCVLWTLTVRWVEFEDNRVHD